MQKAKNVEEYIEIQKAAIAQNQECGTSHYNLAVALLGQRKFNEAEEELMIAIDCSPGLAEAYVQLGGISLQRGDLERCLAYNKEAIKIRPGFSEGYGNIGFIEIQRGNVDEAIAALEKATYFNFRFLQALATLANAYLMKGMIEKCIETNLKALDLEPDFPVVHNNLAIAYLEKGDIPLAVHHCDRALSLGYEIAPEIRTEIESHRSKIS